MTNEQPEQWAVELLCSALIAPTMRQAELLIQRAFTEHTADLVEREKRARDLSIVIVKHIGGGSEWFSRIGDEFYADPAIVDGELQRRKTDAQITKKALIRANRENADLVADNAKLREDALRYRWLRAHSCPPHNFYVSVPDEFHGVKYSPDEVDAYIDAARNALEAPHAAA